MKLFSLLILTAAALSLSSCSTFRQKAQEEAPAPTATAKEVKKSAAPTAAQQAAAHAVLEEQAALQAEEEALLNTPAAPAEISTGGLRLRRFAPPEEAVSSAEGTDIPLPNSAELHGLRSPMLRSGNLPMDINGKITPQPQE